MAQWGVERALEEAEAKEVLKSMPASMVKRIEVITDPGVISLTGGI